MPTAKIAASALNVTVRGLSLVAGIRAPEPPAVAIVAEALAVRIVEQG